MRIKTNGASAGLLTSALALLFAATTATAAPADDIASVSFAHQPESAAEGRFVVELDEEGNWSKLESDHAVWRMNYQIAWIKHPTFIKHLQFFLRPPGSTGDGAFAGAVTRQDPDLFFELFDGTPIVPASIDKTISGNSSAVLGYEGIFVDPVGRCFTKRKQLLESGTPLHSLLSNDWQVETQAHAKAKLRYSTNDDGSYNTFETLALVPVTVLCKGSKAIADKVAPLPSFSAGFKVNEAHLWASHGYHKGACPQEVTLSLKFLTLGKGTLKYKIYSANGKVSKTYTTQVTGKVGGVYGKVVEHKFSVPLEKTDTPSGSSGGGLVGQGSGDFAIYQPPVDPGFPTSPQGPGNFTDQATPGNVHKNSFMVKVTAPNTVESGYDGYLIICDPKLNPGVVAGGAGGLTVQPRPVPSGAPISRLRSSGAKATASVAVKPAGRRVAGPSQMAALAALPDLVIKRATPVPGNHKQLRVLVANQGQGKAGAASLKGFYRRSGKTLTRSARIPALKAAGQAWVLLDFGAPLARASRIDLRADDPNRVKETKEDNNGHSLAGR